LIKKYLKIKKKKSDLSRSEGQVSLPFEKSIERSRFG
jgi:hypothetical protein